MAMINMELNTTVRMHKVDYRHLHSGKRRKKIVMERFKDLPSRIFADILHAIITFGPIHKT